MSTNVTKYADKKAKQKAGTYHGNSPFSRNLHEFQYLKPLHLYPHLKQGGMRVPDPNRKPKSQIETFEDLGEAV